MLSPKREMIFEAEVSYLKLIAGGNLRCRFVSQGLDLKVVEDALGSVKAQEDWLPVWMEVGDMYRQLGEDAFAADHGVSAGEYFFKATLAYHYGQLLHFHDLEGKQRAQLAKVSVYAKARPLLIPPVQHLEASFEDVSIPIDIRTPQGPPPYPTVICISGTDSTKEENFTIGNHLLARGLAVVSFDGPGQGEVWPYMKMRPDFHKVVSVVADTICALSQVDKGRLALIGRSFGGFLAPIVAAYDTRFKACVVNGGYYDTTFYNWDDPLRAVRFQFVLGAQTIDEAKLMAKDYTLAHCIHRVQVPLLIIHGGQDKGVPVSVAKRIADETGGLSTFIEFPEGFHCTPNIAYKANPLTADWLVDHLKSVTNH